MSWILRPERADDGAAIRKVIVDAFAIAAHRDGTEQDIVERLRAANALTVSLVAEDDGRIVGHVAFSPVGIERAHGDWYGLGPASVAPGRQRQGIGDALIREGLRRLTERGAAGCVVLGEPAYYGRFGFTHDPALSYADVPPPFFQRLVFAGPSPTGQVRYHSAFG